MADLYAGLTRGRFLFRDSQVESVVGFLSGATIGAIVTVLDGAKTWREAGMDLAELALAALGLPREEARAIASASLPPPERR